MARKKRLICETVCESLRACPRVHIVWGQSQPSERGRMPSEIGNEQHDAGGDEDVPVLREQHADFSRFNLSIM